MGMRLILAAVPVVLATGCGNSTAGDGASDARADSATDSNDGGSDFEGGTPITPGGDAATAPRCPGEPPEFAENRCRSNAVALCTELRAGPSFEFVTSGSPCLDAELSGVQETTTLERWSVGNVNCDGAQVDLEGGGTLRVDFAGFGWLADHFRSTATGLREIAVTARVDAECVSAVRFRGVAGDIVLSEGAESIGLDGTQLFHVARVAPSPALCADDDLLAACFTLAPGYGPNLVHACGTNFVEAPIGSCGDARPLRVAVGLADCGAPIRIGWFLPAFATRCHPR